MDIKAVRESAKACFRCKEIIMNYIFGKVKEMKESSHDFDLTELTSRDGSHEIAPWARFVQEMHPELYTD